MQVVLAGDIRLLCDGLVHYLRRVPGVTVAGVARTGAEAISQSIAQKPDIVLIDMAMPESLQVVRQIATRAPNVRIVALCVPDDGRAVIACAEAGISAYVSREGSLEDLVGTLKCVMRGEAPVAPHIAAALLQRVSKIAGGAVDERSNSPLTTREEEIAGLLEKGMSNKQIARELDIRLPTVKNHVHHILEKLQVSRRADLNRRQAHAHHGSNEKDLDRHLNLS
jgi:two-component system, NarL family, nitrate/nitrite response regulator NarL